MLTPQRKTCLGQGGPQTTYSHQARQGRRLHLCPDLPQVKPLTIEPQSGGNTSHLASCPCAALLPPRTGQQGLLVSGGQSPACPHPMSRDLWPSSCLPQCCLQLSVHWEWAQCSDQAPAPAGRVMGLSWFRVWPLGFRNCFGQET